MAEDDGGRAVARTAEDRTEECGEKIAWQSIWWPKQEPKRWTEGCFWYVSGRRQSISASEGRFLPVKKLASFTTQGVGS